MNLFTQNSDLRKTGIYGWTLPAHWVTLSNGERFNTCPNAGVCGALCYAKSGTYNFKNVKKAHLEKLELALGDLEVFKTIINEELAKKKYIGKYIRIHDAGDFFSYNYMVAWMQIANLNPQCIFYAYTKEVKMHKTLMNIFGKDHNFIAIYSFGGKQDHLIDRNVDRHSDVFTDYNQMIAAGYNDIGEDDKQAAIHPNHKVGLYRNNIKHFIKKQGEYTFGEWQNKRKKIYETDNNL
jgi:hypothetical protein